MSSTDTNNWTAARVYAAILILSSIIGGIVNLYQLLIFIANTKQRFLSTRNPPLIIIYCIVGLSTSLITIPLNLYMHFLVPIFHDTTVPFFPLFAIEFFMEFCTAVMLILILSRAWLLYYDYKFSESSSDLIWRNIVDSNEKNFWISYRKTFGNLYFIICASLTIDSISLCCLSLVGTIALHVEDALIFHYFTLFGLGIPFYLFIVYLIMHRIELVNDIYLIQKEIKYLSWFILARIIAFFVDLFFHKYDEELFFYTAEVMTLFFSIYIQCWWVLNQLAKSEEERDLDEYIQMQRAPSNSVVKHMVPSPRSRNNSNKGRLKMEDILDEEISFATFIRHCTQELSVEAILFLIEVSQFKATLEKYNAAGFEAVMHRFVDVNTSNLVQFVKQKREQRINEKLIIHPAPAAADDEQLSPPLCDNGSDSVSPAPTPPPSASAYASVAAAVTISSLSKSVSLKQNAAVASYHQEAEYKRFQETVLDKKWLPIARPLLAVSEGGKQHLFGGSSRRDTTNTTHDSTERSGTRSGTGTKTGTGTGTKAKTPFTKSSRNLPSANNLSNGSKDKLSYVNAENGYITPIALAVIEDSHQPISRSVKDDSKTGEDSVKKSTTVDVHWMFDYGRHLFNKYVDNSADLMINVSHDIRRKLWSVYSKEVNAEAFQKIQLIHHEDLSKISRLTTKEEHLFIQSFLYHSFDLAFHSVWLLLQSDTFYRFQKTPQYKKLCDKIDAQKLQNAREQRDKEYSRSYQETFLEI